MKIISNKLANAIIAKLIFFIKYLSNCELII